MPEKAANLEFIAVGVKFWLLSYNSVLVMKIRRMYINLNLLLRTGLVRFFFVQAM